MKLPVLKIGDKVAEMPIFQGGMAIRLSTCAPCRCCSKRGGVGLVAASGLELDELRQEIRLARKLSEGRGMIGINAMVAARAFADLITTAAEEKVDFACCRRRFFQEIFSPSAAPTT